MRDLFINVINFVFSYFLTDTDECQDNNGGCQSLCKNNIGGHECSCAKGFKLQPDGKTCVGECQHRLCPSVIVFLR